MDVLFVSVSDGIMNFFWDFFPPSVGCSTFVTISVGLIIIRIIYVKRLQRSGRTEEDWFHPVWILTRCWRFLRRVYSWFQRLRRNADPEDETVVKTTDELYCDYDSTWDSEEGSDSKGPKRPPAARKPGMVQDKFATFCRASRDMQKYRHGCSARSNSGRSRPQSSTSDFRPNLNFYLGRTHSQPDGIFIKDFHNYWRGQYDILEYTHTFIQWLFPLRERGVNSAASPLTEEEVEAFCQSHEAKANLLESYKLMLDFYGMELCNDQTGEVKRAENWAERFKNLNNHLHNNLRITRIIKCLGILGYRHLQAPLVHFFLKESLVEGELPYVKDSILNYFMFAVLDKGERKKLVEFAYFNYHPKDEFVWCSKKIQMLLQQKQLQQKQLQQKQLQQKQLQQQQLQQQQQQ